MALGTVLYLVRTSNIKVRDTCVKDFKKQNGFKISREIAKKYNMYAQSYCGCEFSIRN